MNNYRMTYEDELFIEANFDKKWEEKHELNMARIKKAVKEGDEKFLDKCFRLINSQLGQTYMGVRVVMTAPVLVANPLLIPVLVLGAMLDIVVFGLIGEAIFDKRGMHKAESYKKMLDENIRRLEAGKRKLDPKDDKEQIANIDKALKSLRKNSDLCQKKLSGAKLEHYDMTSTDAVKSIFESVKLV